MDDLDIMTQARNDIQNIDIDILKLLELRAKKANIIGHIKKSQGAPIYAPEVEKKKIETLSEMCRYPGLVEAIWPVIMCYTRTVE